MCPICSRGAKLIVCLPKPCLPPPVLRCIFPLVALLRELLELLLSASVLEIDRLRSFRCQFLDCTEVDDACNDATATLERTSTFFHPVAGQSLEPCADCERSRALPVLKVLFSRSRFCLDSCCKLLGPWAALFSATVKHFSLLQ